MAKRIVVCCDGTWKDSDSGEAYTNVSRLAWAIMPADTRGAAHVPQIVFYQSGVGSEGDLFNRLAGGGVGFGLSRNVRDAYAFICNNYSEGDEIFLFGFSRGAYTARSVGGLIGYAGLIGKRDLDRFDHLWTGYRLRDKVKHPDPRPDFKTRKAVRIKAIGVWDTVGSLGVPGNLDKVFTDFYEFHDTGLGLHIDNAFHALALDEKRKAFLPTLWHVDPTAKDDPKAKDQVLKQVWFAGVHSNVGGGYDEHGLSDITLAWMAGEVDAFVAIDFDYLKLNRDLRTGWGLGMLYDSARHWEALGLATRKPFSETRITNEFIHPSVSARIRGAAGATPAGYASGALKGVAVDGKLCKLSPREQELEWGAADVKPVAAEEKPREFSVDKIKGKILGLFGG